MDCDCPSIYTCRPTTMGSITKILFLLPMPTDQPDSVCLCGAGEGGGRMGVKSSSFLRRETLHTASARAEANAHITGTGAVPSNVPAPRAGCGAPCYQHPRPGVVCAHAVASHTPRVAHTVWGCGVAHSCGRPIRCPTLAQCHLPRCHLQGWPDPMTGVAGGEWVRRDPHFSYGVIGLAGGHCQAFLSSVCFFLFGHGMTSWEALPF